MRLTTLIVGLAALAAMAACRKLPESGGVASAFTLAWVCPDKQEVYRLSDGRAAQWNVTGESGYFAVLAPELNQASYCSGHGAPAAAGVVQGGFQQ